MSRPLPPDAPESLRRAHEEAERPLSREEFEAHLASELSDDERAEKRALIAWFTRRYPTAESRLAYARRYARAIRRAFGP